MLMNLELEKSRAQRSTNVRAQFRARKVGILYDDAYGLWTEEGQASGHSWGHP